MSIVKHEKAICSDCKNKWFNDKSEYKKGIGLICKSKKSGYYGEYCVDIEDKITSCKGYEVEK